MTGVSTVQVAEDDADIRLDRWFKRHYAGLSHVQLQKLLRKGQVRVDGKRARAGDRLSPGQMVRVPPLKTEPQAPPPRPRDADGAEIRQWILYQDETVIVLNKPPGLAVQGGSGVRKSIDGMLDALRAEGGERPKLVHRLDKDTSGVLVLGRSARAAAKLTEAFRSKTARKVYWAVVVGEPAPEAGRIDLALSKLPGQKGERMVPDAEQGKRAMTDYRLVERAGRKAAWLSLEPLSGRTHQLRVHMQALGTPILGDGKYGGQESFLQGPGLSRKMHLHARAIRMPHPDGGVLEAVAPLPPHMLATWAFLGFEEALEADPFPEKEDWE